MTNVLVLYYSRHGATAEQRAGFEQGEGGALVTIGALLWMKRRDYRATQSGYDPRAIDD